MDLDDFKAVNDAHGHRTGDQLLCAVARRIAPLVAPDDTLARLGADEFVIVSLVETPDEAALLSDRLTAAIAEPLLVEGMELLVTASIGIALFPDDAAGERELMGHASAAGGHRRHPAPSGRSG